MSTLDSVLTFLLVFNTAVTMVYAVLVARRTDAISDNEIAPALFMAGVAAGIVRLVIIMMTALPYQLALSGWFSTLPTVGYFFYPVLGALFAEFVFDVQFLIWCLTGYWLDQRRGPITAPTVPTETTNRMVAQPAYDEYYQRQQAMIAAARGPTATAKDTAAASIKQDKKQKAGRNVIR